MYLLRYAFDVVFGAEGVVGFVLEVRVDYFGGFGVDVF